MQQMFGLVSARARVGRTGNQIFLLYDSAAVCCVFTGRLFTNILSIILALFLFLMPFFLQWSFVKSPQEETLVWKHLYHPGNAAGARGFSPGHLWQGRKCGPTSHGCFYDPKQFLVVRAQLIIIFLFLCQSVSYAQFLYPTNALVRQKPSSSSDLTLQIPVSRSTHSIPGRSYPPSRLSSTVGLDLGKKWNRAQSQRARLLKIIMILFF